MPEFELKLASGKDVVWEGDTWEAAAKRYVGMHPEESVIAWRNYPRSGVFVLGDADRIKQPEIDRQGRWQ